MPHNSRGIFRPSSGLYRHVRVRSVIRSPASRHSLPLVVVRLSEPVQASPLSERRVLFTLTTTTPPLGSPRTTLRENCAFAPQHPLAQIGYRLGVELTALRYFRVIAQQAHMTRAAQTLGVTQPALSAVVKKLEAEVGTELLDRTGRGVSLTQAGELFLKHAEDALRAADDAAKAVRQLVGLEAGSLRVGGGATATTYLLPPVISVLRRAHPGLRFFIREAGSTAVAAAVLSGELDIGIVTMPARRKWKLPGSQDLLTIPLVEDELRLIHPPTIAPPASQSHRAPNTARAPARQITTRKQPDVIDRPSTDSTPFRWQEIAREPFVAFEAGTAVRTIIDTAAAAAGVSLNVVMELRSIESIKSMVHAGIGLGIVSRFALAPGEGRACREGRLARELAVVRRRDRIPSHAAAAFELELRSKWSTGKPDSKT
jgi:DNA-binding transcriptional LysR family regulator